MQARNRLGIVLVAIAIGSRFWASTAAAGASAPLFVTASTGPAAGARVTTSVTRTVGGKTMTLPGALVPALKPGDIVDVDFPDYRRPPSTVNYHVNVAFITETARQHWLFERSSPVDRLFSNGRRGHKGGAPRTGRIHFVYGAGRNRGIPIFFIIPEDDKTRGVDGLRDYVGAHPTDFVRMSESTNDAVDQYGFLRDFLISLAGGSIDPVSARDRIETITQSFGVSPAAIDGCYATGNSTADVRNCIQQAVNTVVYQTNFSAPTQAQFLGGVAGAATPTIFAPYIASLLTVWRLFVGTGHHEYEYLPTTLSLADPSTARRDELLMGLKVPTVRPPAAASDVLFFTIGDPQAAERAPHVVNSAPVDGVCERASRFSVPLQFDHTSRYVHDAALFVTPNGRAPYTIPLDPRSLAAPVVERSRFRGSSDGAYTVSLVGRFGFDSVVQPERVSARLAFPAGAPWSITAVPHHPPIAGETLDIIASSAQAPCLSRAEMQIGSAPLVPLTTRQLDARRVELRASLDGVPAGPAVIRLYQDGPRASHQIETTSAFAVAPPPPQVNVKSAIASLGDTFVDLAGSGFERVHGMLVAGSTYEKEPGASATSACFDGPPVGGGTSATGQELTAQLLPNDSSPGEVFPLTIAAIRPRLAPLIAASGPPAHLSTTTLAVTLQSVTGALPRQVAVRVRRVDGPAATPCVALQPDPTAVTLPDSTVHLRSANALLVDFRADVLGDRAFGTLQMQIVDAATAIGSNWQPIPGTFARAPEVTQITCPTAAGEMCRLYGNALAAIDAVQDGTGAFVTPESNCPPTAKGIPCVYVPHLAQYTLRLVDGGTLETLSNPPVTR